MSSKAERRKAAKKAVKDANKKLKNSVDLLSEAERRSLLLVETARGPVEISSWRHSQLDEEVQAWVVELWKRNMEDLMRGSDWGFDPEDKAQELGANSSKYLLARSLEGVPVAYCHFRYDMDEGFPVNYCYELQTEAEWQGQGLGARFLLLLHLFAQRTKMAKIVATVLKSNAGSDRFFRRQGYEEDESNVATKDFWILSKDATAPLHLPTAKPKVVRFAGGAEAADEEENQPPDSD